MTRGQDPRPRRRTPGRLDLLGALVALVVACGLGAGVAWAFWSADAAPGGHGAAVAATVGQGATPVAAVEGTSVTVRWEAASLSDGTAVTGYVLTRYDADTLTPQPLLSACTGTVTALSCTEDDVPPGRWAYSVTPAYGASWRGPESLRSNPVRIDSTPPVNAVTLSGVSGNAVKIGDTVYYRGAAGGAFTLTNAVSDSGSGPASSTTAPLAGSSSGWSHTPSTVSLPEGGPFVSAPFSWEPGTSSEPDEVVTGSDVAGNTATTELSFVDDSDGPTGGSVNATGLVGTGPAYAASTSVSLTFAKGTDPRGVAPTGALLQRATATLTSDGSSDGDCGDFGAFATVTGGTDPASPKVDTVADQACYRYQYVVKDTWGNATTYPSGEVKVDTTAPAAPTRTFQTSGSTYWNGSSALVYYRSAAPSGSFTVTARATDPASGIAAYNFPTAAVFGNNWSTTPGAPGVMTYSWSGTPASVTAKSITATNHAGKTSTASATFTPTVDNTAPTAGSVTYPNTATASTSVNVAFTTGTDTGSGLDDRLLQRASAPLTGGTCGQFSAFTTIATNPTASPYVDSVTEGSCYQYQYDTPDNVGNPRLNTSTSVVRVSSDVTGPTGGSVTATGLLGTGSAYAASTSVTLALDPGTDPSGVAMSGNLLQRASAPLTSTGGADGVCGIFGSFTTVTGGTDPASPFTNTGATTAFCWRYQYVVRDSLGNSTTYTSADVKVDTSASSTPTRTFDSFDNTWWPSTGNVVYYRSTASSGSFRTTASATDAQSGISTYNFPALGTNWSSTPGGLGVTTYSWSGSPASPGAKSITATNNAGVTSAVSTTFTPTADSTAPTAGSVTYANGGTPTTSTTVSFTTGTDSGSGLATRLLQRASAPLTGGTCGTFSAFSTIATNPVSPYTDSSLVMDTCYRYQYETPDNVGNQRTNITGSVVRVSTDVDGPTGGSVTATGLIGTGSAYAASTTVSLALDKGTDPSGVAATGNLLRRASASLTSTGGADGVCGTFGAYTTVSTDPATPTTNVVTDQFCYSYQYVVADALGNTTTYTSNEVKVDTTAPAAPTRTFQTSGSTYWNGSSALVYYRSAAPSGSFTVTASATDPASGIAAYTFPTAAAFGTGWSATPGGLGVMTYSWLGVPATVTAKSVTATNNAAKLSTASATFTPTVDNTAPTAGSVTYPDTTTTSTTVSVSFTTGTDSGSGIGTRLLQRAAAPLVLGSCGAYDAFTTVATDPGASPYVDTVPSGACYKYQYVVSDNVGNQTTATSTNTVKVGP